MIPTKTTMLYTQCSGTPWRPLIPHAHLWERKGPRQQRAHRAARMVKLLLGVLLGVLSLASVGCGGELPRQQVRWDLRQSHAKSAVNWPGDTDIYELDNVDATVLLPGDRTFTGQRINLHLFSLQDQIFILAIEYPRTTVGEGYRQAKRLCQEWQLRTDELESWYQDASRGNLSFYAVMAGYPLDPGGPTPYAKLLDSFDEQQPIILDLEFQWV